ncbi:MAG: hypothetical protein LH468_12020 [Nocardioides sp.]|nr:hypothetical protein [Nocardioides sp.]
MTRPTVRLPLCLLSLAILLPTLLVGALPALAAGEGADKSGKGKGDKPAAASTYSATKTLTRVFRNADGTTLDFPPNTVTVDVDQTRNLRGRQRVNITWSGAQPSGGRASNPYGENGLQQEYPVVIMQCRGTDDPSLPLAEQLRPETCFTASVAQRSQVSRSDAEASWRNDLDAEAGDRARVSGADPFPAKSECPTADIEPFSTHLTPFVAADGTVYAACDSAHMPPEAAVGAAFPANEIAAFTDPDGNGSVRFEVRSDVENESLGCSEKVDCSIVVIPINGLSCDVPPTETPSPSSSASPSAAPTDTAGPTPTPPTDQNGSGLSESACRKGGQFTPGSSNFVNGGVDQAVSPALWWSESNWKNRFAVPVTFGLPPDTCDVLDPRPPTGFYGSELLAQASLQWSPAYCLDKKRFKFQLNQMSDDAGFKLMQAGGGAAAVVSSEHTSSGGEKIGYAPTAVTGFGIGYAIDRPDNAGEFTDLKLNARLIAKLLTQSYLGSALGRGHPGIEANPLGIMNDPEFIELNPGLSEISQEAGASLLSLSNASDIIEQLTDYLTQDKDATDFIAGKPDPWGMKVNPAYKKLKLPRDEFPLLDEFVPTTPDVCRTNNPAVYFTQLAAPVTSLRKVADSLLDGWPNVQTRCDTGLATGSYKLGRVDRQSYGARFVLGLVSLGDAERFGLRTAALETDKGKYVAPSTSSLAAGVKLTTQDKKLEPFALDQADVRTSGRAYPGTMIVYTAAKLSGLLPEDATKVAQFMRVSTTEGQQAGSGNGELPAGYLPITKSGVTAKLFASAQAVADAVEAQKDSKPAEAVEEPASTGEVTSSSAAPPPSSSAGPVDSAPAAEDAAVEAPAVVAPAPALPASAPVAMPATGAVSSGLAGRLLPTLMVIGLLGLGAATGMRFFVRPPRRRQG